MKILFTICSDMEPLLDKINTLYGIHVIAILKIHQKLK